MKEMQTPGRIGQNVPSGKFLQMLGLDQQHSEEDACRMEHVLSEAAMNGISDFLHTGDTYDRMSES